MVGCAVAGAYNICRSVVACALGQFLRPPVLPDLQRKGLVRQGSLSADLSFWSFFIKEKGLGPPAAMSGTMT